MGLKPVLGNPLGGVVDVTYLEDGKVPYTGATQDVELGAKALTVGGASIPAITSGDIGAYGPTSGTWNGTYAFTLYHAVPTGGGNYLISSGFNAGSMSASPSETLVVTFTDWYASATHLFIKHSLGGADRYGIVPIIDSGAGEWYVELNDPFTDADSTLGGTITSSDAGYYANYGKDGYAVDSSLPIRASNFSGSSSGTNTGDQDLSLYAKTNRGVTVGYSGGNVSTLTYSDGSTKTLSYNGSGQLSSIVYGGTGPHFTKTFSYNGDGTLSGVTIS